MRLQLATLLLQWATGGLLVGWVTTRRREVGLGYGWLLRITYLVMAGLGALAGRLLGGAGAAAPLRDLLALGVAAAAGTALAVSVVRRRAGVAGERAQRASRAARVAAMTSRTGPDALAGGSGRVPGTPAAQPAEFPPGLDLVAPGLGVLGLVAAAAAGGGLHPLGLARLLSGAVFLGVVTDAMLLGHWYLVQPRLGRAPLRQLVWLLVASWPVEVALFLWPPGMPAVLAGRIDDGAGGLLGIIWVGCALSTITFAGAVLAALRERSYAAVMAATGLLYLAILTAFGTDLLARAALAP